MSKKTSSFPSKNKTARKRLSSRRSTPSVWVATSSIIRSSALDKNIRADVCVVGAGIAGMTSAYLLAREGKSVVVADKNGIARGATEFRHSRPAEKRQPGDGSQRIAIYSCDCANHDRKVFLSVQKHSFLETSIWTWIIRS